jgi:hypothetical protein
VYTPTQLQALDFYDSYFRLAVTNNFQSLFCNEYFAATINSCVVAHLLPSGRHFEHYEQPKRKSYLLSSTLVGLRETAGSSCTIEYSTIGILMVINYDTGSPNIHIGVEFSKSRVERGPATNLLKHNVVFTCIVLFNSRNLKEQKRSK